MMGATYKTKKDLKAAIGKPLRYVETSFFGEEYKSNGTFNVVGPSPTDRKWYATVTMVDGKIAKVA
jgi:cytochrome c biogenesis protein ResB